MTDFEDANAEFMRLADSVAIEARLEMQNYKDSMKRMCRLYEKFADSKQNRFHSNISDSIICFCFLQTKISK